MELEGHGDSHGAGLGADCRHLLWHLGFPNLFMITGPQSPWVKTQMILAGQQHTDWIAEFLEYMRLNGFTRFNVEQQAEDAWVLHNNDIAESTLYPLANSWYVGANVPGKPRVFMPWAGGTP